MARKKEHSDFVKEIFNLVGNEYTVISNYINNKEKIILKHNLCNNEYEVSPIKFTQGRRCPYCAGNKKPTDKEFKLRVELLVGDKFIFKEEYKNSDTPLLCSHKKCGYEWKITPHHFLDGIRCPKCANNAKKTQEDFIKDSLEKRGNDYKVIGKYKNNNTPIEILHEKCGRKWNVSPVKFLAGRSCPYCVDRNNSKNVIIIKKWLNNNNIPFEVEKTFENCKYKQQLYFDFFIPSKNILIEYDGEFHHKSYSGYPEELEEQIKRDNVKNEFVIQNKELSLFRIKYNDEIIKILEKILK
jgi:Zn ribbon nucleic-acid-binding protein